MTAVPTWEKFLAPSLRVLDDGALHSARSIRDAAAEELGVTQAAKSELIPSGQRRWENRANWALSYLGRHGAAERPARGSYRITEGGRRLLAERPDGIVQKDLVEILGPPIVGGAPDDAPVDLPELVSNLDPIEQIDAGVAAIHSEVSTDLLMRLHGQEPAFFEQAVVDLIVAMGYGGADGASTRTQLSNDGGIDGIVDQDALGLSRVYIQAKRYALDSAVQRPEIQGFVGALHGVQANQGVFITTGRFSSGAEAYARSVASRIVLIDGRRLATLMIRYGVGVQNKRTVRIVEIDEDFFE